METARFLGPSLGLSAILFSLGVAGVLLRRNAIVLHSPARRIATRFFR